MFGIVEAVMRPQKQPQESRMSEPSEQSAPPDENPAGGAEAVLSFWFAPGRERDWFMSSEQFDAELRAAWLAPHLAAAAGRLEHWRETPRGALALVLLLDQAPRNLFRRTARAFGCDRRALRVSAAAVERAQDLALSPQERVFLYMPYQHAEDLAAQERSLELFARLGADGDNAFAYAGKHHEIIKRFGRFPHRNAALGRANTPDEEAYLSGAIERFGQ
ncbi:MAG: DUF924 domain-containing protein [Alphaproteobacteria bacterium]|nr:DUF924 domain-containing protein [Alphaproteobacteria bacterium]